MQVPALRNPYLAAYVYGLLLGPMTLPCAGPIIFKRLFIRRRQLFWPGRWTFVLLRFWIGFWLASCAAAAVGVDFTAPLYTLDHAKLHAFNAGVWHVAGWNWPIGRLHRSAAKHFMMVSACCRYDPSVARIG